MGYSPWDQRVRHGLATKHGQGFLVIRTMLYKKETTCLPKPQHTDTSSCPWKMKFSPCFYYHCSKFLTSRGLH